MEHDHCQLVHVSCSHGPLVVLDVLDRIRDGYFDAVTHLLLAATLSRVPHDEEEGHTRWACRELTRWAFRSSARWLYARWTRPISTSKFLVGSLSKLFSVRTAGLPCSFFSPRMLEGTLNRTRDSLLCSQMFAVLFVDALTARCFDQCSGRRRILLGRHMGLCQLQQASRAGHDRVHHVSHSEPLHEQIVTHNL